MRHARSIQPPPRRTARLETRRPRATAAELETAEGSRRPPPAVVCAPASEPLAMLVRRGFSPRVAPPDLPFPRDLPGEAQDRIAERLGHYAFRLFLRGAILRGGSFTPGEATRYLSPRQAAGMARELVALGLAAPAGRGRFALTHPAHSFGGVLEWYLARELSRRLGFEVATGVQFGAKGVGGDLDVVAAAEGKLLHAEVKSGPPKHLTDAEVDAFLDRAAALQPDLALFVMDTALRLSDKVLPMLAAALARRGASAAPPRRVIRETWCVAPRLYAVNAKQDLVENVCRAIADGLRGGEKVT